jgi:nifR3 family TIM-barrel protein
MPKNFWQKLKKPFFILAPMADVTDIAFRQIIAKYGKPDVFYTEFVSTDGLCSKGQDNLLPHLKFKKNEHPIVVQFFGAKPENFYDCAKLANKLGFDGIDINMGCPDKKVEKQGGGAALMKNPKLAREIIRATKQGAGKLPVSIKTRIGYNSNIINTWLPELLKEKPAAICVHARTRKEMSEAKAHWDAMAEAVKIAQGTGVLIIGNGDVSSLEDARIKAKESGADGIMIGRAAFGNPWFFNKKIKLESLPLQKRFKAMVEHTLLFEKNLGGLKNFNVMKKHFKAYVSGFTQAKSLRIKLMKTKNAAEVQGIINEFFEINR